MTQPPTGAAAPWHDCPCGHVHPKGCHAHTTRDGTRRPCGAPATTGLTVCFRHGGATPTAKAKAARAKTEIRAAREVARLGVKITTHPAEALIDLVHWTAGEVAYWRDVVTQLERDGGHQALTWGVTRIKEGGDDAGTTQEAKPHAAYLMLTQASDRLASYATAALKAGVDERRVALAERHGNLVAGAIRAILADLGLSPEQEALVGEVVPRHLRALAGGAS